VTKHRDRVLAALNHHEPDRVPIDLGGTVVTAIAAVTYRDLRNALGLPRADVYVADTYQQVAEMDQDVVDSVGCDVAGIYPRPREWQSGRLIDGTPAKVPSKWHPKVLDDGSQVVHDQDGHVVMKMPKNGFYFDVVYHPMSGPADVADLDKHMDWMRGLDLSFYLDMTYEELGAQARHLREHTEFLVAAHFGGQFLGGGQKLRGYGQFMLDLAEDPVFAEALMDRLLEVYMERFERFARTIGPYVDVIEVDDDLGMQEGPD
jgi:uroporphyrinogen decarboxylase